MERNREDLDKEMATLAFYMQGGLSFGDAHLLSANQRKNMTRVIKKHYEQQSGKPNSKLIDTSED